jgi:hypothetical protein
MVKILNHKGNAIQNSIEILSTPVRLAIIKKTNNNKCWEDVEEKEPLYTIDENIN